MSQGTARQPVVVDTVRQPVVVDTTRQRGGEDRATAPRRASPLRRALAWVAVLLALGGVFAAYQQPEFVAEMARQAWACL